MLSSQGSHQSIQTQFLNPFVSHPAEQRPVAQGGAALHALCLQQIWGLNLPSNCPGAHLHKGTGTSVSVMSKPDPASVTPVHALGRVTMQSRIRTRNFTPTQTPMKRGFFSSHYPNDNCVNLLFPRY